MLQKHDKRLMFGRRSAPLFDGKILTSTTYSVTISDDVDLFSEGISVNLIT